MPLKEMNKAVTARFPTQDYLLLQQEAEKRGCTIAEVVRNAWRHYEQQQQMQQQLLRLEQRQRKSIFEMLCSVIGLQPHEREQAIEQLQQQGIQW